MAAINDLQTWQNYCQFRELVLRDWREKNNIPDEFLPYFEKPLTLKDFSQLVVINLIINYGMAISNEYAIDKDNKSTIELIAQYLRQDEAFLKVNSAYSFKKGLLLHGPVGTGKTTLFKALRAMISNMSFYDPNKELRQAFLPCCFNIISANEIVRRFSISGNEIFTQNNAELIQKPICLDDVGTEGEAAYYGVKTNILAEILQVRYDRGSLTHISTNLNMSALKDAYGPRVFDRMREMLNDLPLTGNSRRK